MTRVLIIVLAVSACYGQAPSINNLTVDSITARSARIYWRAGFYHDASTDTTLTAGFSLTSASIAENATISVASTANMVGISGPIGTHPTHILVDGRIMGQVQNILSGTSATVSFNGGAIGGSSYAENFFYALPGPVGAGLSVSITGTNSSDGVATATLPFAPGVQWAAGHYIQLLYASTMSDQLGAIISRVDSTHITFPVNCAPTCNGTHDTTTDPDMKLLDLALGTFANGSTVSFISTDAVLCYGNPGGSSGVYPNQLIYTAPFPAQDDATVHRLQLTNQTPGSTIHFIVLSTPNQIGNSSCSAIGAHTGQSSDQTITFPSSESSTPVAPTGTSFSTAPPACGHVVASSCANLQSDITTAQSTSGCTVLTLPANTPCTAPSGGWTLGAQTNGATTLTIRTSASDGSLPAQGACIPPLVTGGVSPCIDNTSYATALVPITANASLSSIFRTVDLKKVKDVHIGPGLKFIANDQISLITAGLPVIELAHVYRGGHYGHSYHPENVVIDRCYFTNPNSNNGSSWGIDIAGGVSIGIVDNVMENIANRQQDVGGIIISSPDLLDGGFIVKNNRIQAAFNGLYLDGEGWNTGNGIIQRNYFSKKPEWNPMERAYDKQIQLNVASVATGSVHTIFTLAQPSEFALGNADSYVSFSGITNVGTWAALNAREFTMIAGTLTGVNCAAGTCTATTSGPHGFSSGDIVALRGIDGYPCYQEIGPHPITGVTTTTLTWTSSGTVAHCQWPDAGLIGPMFLHQNNSNTTMDILFNSAGFPAMTGSVQMRYGGIIDDKNNVECKTCVAWDISGNMFEYSPTFEQNGVSLAITNKTSAGITDIVNWGAHTTISDINVHDNWLKRNGIGISMQGLHDYHQNVMMNRVTIKNNLSSFPDPILCVPGQGCARVASQMTFGNNIIWDHNTFMNTDGAFGTSMFSPPMFGNWTVNNSIFNFGSIGVALSTLTGGCTGTQIYLDAACQFNSTIFTWDRNLFMGTQIDSGAGDDWLFGKQYYDGVTYGSIPEYQRNFWPHNITGIKYTGQTAITGATNASPIVLTTGSLSCVPAVGDRVMVTGVRGNLAANGYWLVQASSPTSLTLLGSIGSGSYTASTGFVIPVLGQCDLVGNWKLSGTSPYLAGTPYIAPSADTITAGQGNALDGTDIGVDTSSLTSHIAGCALAPGSLPNATVTESYSQNVTATGCGASTFTISAGSLSGSGLSLNASTGAITGTVTGAAATYTFTVAYDTASQPYSIVVSATPTITAGTLPHGLQGSAYSQTLCPTSCLGTGTVTCALTSGSLSGSGITLSSCALTGTGGTPGTYTGTITPTDSLGVVGSAYPLTLVIDPLLPAFTGSALRGTAVKGVTMR